MFDLSGKVALVTGGSRGLGRAISLAFARQGADVAVNYRGNADAAKEVVDRHPPSGPERDRDPGRYQAGREACEAIVKEALDEFGKIDILVNNAGITRDNLMMRMGEEEWQPSHRDQPLRPILDVSRHRQAHAQGEAPAGSST